MRRVILTISFLISLSFVAGDTMAQCSCVPTYRNITGVVNASVLGQKAGGLYISISETRREHSRDSYSISKTITISGNALLYEETGRRGKQVHEEYRLTNQEIVKLRQLISERNLLMSRSVEYPEATGPHTSIELNLELKSNRKRSLIRISGPINSKELENDRVYKNANAFLEEITEMIHAKDESKPRRTEAGLSQTSKYLLRI